MISEEEIPDHWKWMEFEEAVNILDRQRDPVKKSVREERTEGMDKSEMIPYYGATGQTGWIDDYIFDKELVLLGEDGAPFSNPAAEKLSYMIEGKSWVSNHAHVLEGKEGIMLNKFLCYILRSIDYTPYVNGSTRKKLTQTSMKKINLPVPPLKEQEMIVEKLNKIFKGINDIENAQSRVDNLEDKFLQSIIYSLIEEQAEEDGWEWKEIGDVLNYRSNNMEPQDYPEKEFNYISLKHIGKGTGEFKEVEKTYGKEIKSTKREFSENQILYGKLRPYLNKVVAPDFEGICSTDIIVFEPAEEHNREYLQLCLLSARIRNKAENMMSGANLPRIKKNDLLEFKIPVPSQEVQKAIVEKYHSLKDNYGSLRESEEKRNEITDDLPKSVLSEAFKGNLVDFQPDETEDEDDEKNKEEKELKFDGKGQQKLKELT